MLGGGGRRRAEPGRRAARTSFALSSPTKPSTKLLPCPRKPVKQHNRCFYWPQSAAAAQLFVSQRLFLDLSSAGSATFSASHPTTRSASLFSNPTSRISDPAAPPSLHSFRPQTAVRGRPNPDWGQDLLHKIYRLSGVSRREVGIIAQDRRQFHQFVERLCSLVDQS